MRRWIRGGLWTLGGLVLLLLVTLTVLWGLLASQGGSRWMLERVPGLTVEEFDGALLGSWQAGRVHWQNDGLQAELQGVDMQLDTSCLWRGAVCLQQLQMQRLDVQLPDSADDEDEPATDVQLPDVSLPLDVEVGSLAVGAVYLNDEQLVEDFVLAATLVAGRLELDSLSLAHDAYQARLSGSLQLTGDWPLDMQLDAEGELPELGRQQLAIHLSGALQQTLELQAGLKGALNGQLQGQVAPLQAALPASLELVLDRLQLAHLLPEELAVGRLELVADGSLEQGFNWQLNSLLKASQQSFSLVARGQADVGGARVDQLLLSDGGQGRLQLQATASWQDALNATASLELEQFPWHLWAGLDETPVAIRQGRLKAGYAQERWQAELDVGLTGPAGDFSITSQLQGDEGHLQAEPLLVTAGSGRVQGRLETGWQEAVTWLATLEIDQLDPAYWVADLPGELAGTLQSSGRLDKALSLEAVLELDGELRGQPLNVRLQALGQDKAWQVPLLDLRLGSNSLQGQLQLDEQLAGHLDIALPAPGQLLPGASGSLQGEVRLGGSLQAADLDVQLAGKRLAFAGQRMSQLQLNGQLREGQQGSLDVQARGLASGDQFLGRLQLKAEGDLATHQLQASLNGPLVNTDVALQGALEPDSLHWLGQLQQLKLVVENQQWALEQPLAIDYLHEQHARLGAHCLVSSQGRLCAEGYQQLLPRLQLDYQLRNLALASLQPWLPEGLALEGQLQGHFKLQEQAEGVRGSVLLDAAQGAVVATREEQRFAWQEMQLRSELLPQRVNTRISLRGAQQGELLLDAKLDPRPANKPLSGSFKLSGVQLEALHPFVEELAQLQGRMDGQGQLAGTLMQPVVKGDIRLREAEIGGGLLPMTMEQLQLDLKIDGQQARLQGGWRSGEGQASLQGNLDWMQSLQARLHLKGQQLPVFVPPYADVLVSPDLHIDYDDAGLAVTGTLAVPSGSIEVPELPPDTVSVSEDAQVVGREPTAEGMPVRMDINVEVGSERLTFSGFGLTADVVGRLHVTDNLAGNGVLELQRGRFRGYGQRLDLRRARLLFSGPLTQPYVDIEAVRVTGNVTAGLRILGLAEQPQTRIFSEPAMAEEQALSWLLTGKPLGGSNDGSVMAEAAVAMGLMGVLPVTQKLADSLGIRDFELDSEGSGDQTSVVASGQITERLSLRYGVGVFEPASTLGLRYQLTKRLYLDAASGLANSLDLFYRRNF